MAGFCAVRGRKHIFLVFYLQIVKLFIYLELKLFLNSGLY